MNRANSSLRPVPGEERRIAMKTLIMRLRVSFCCAAIAIFCLVATEICAYAQTLTGFDPPGSIATYPSSINALGEITGSYRDALNTPHGFVRDAGGKLTSFDPPGWSGTFPTSINARGEITGYYGNVISLGFIRDARGAFTTFDPPGSLGTVPTSINDVGEVAGYYYVAGGGVHGFVRDARGAFISF